MADHRSPQDSFELYQRVVWFFTTLVAFVTASSVIYILVSHGFLTRSEPLSSEVFAGRHRLNNLILGIHILTALPPLMLGPFNFIRRYLRTRYHRWSGWVYVVTIFVSSITGFALATANAYGIFAKLGFATLAVVWFFTTWMALKTALARRLREHREWMLRSYLITLAVVTVRMLPHPAFLTLDQWYPFITWLCWVPNLILAELYIRATTYKGRLRSDWRARLLARRSAPGR
ncbi:DUF2306 domain-containing protein [Bradymonadaceae bacterium TMQ3]|nr:DUF2306 domain-containing protein [Bradymonadaceae bacterium TMQ3]TXC77630.1 DUF2306 domain-containing protein [Bradymonadales bacterium TMQ1]